jgi:hypothetical protein
VTEYGLALVLASSAMRLPNPALPIGAAVVILLLAATADGPAAAAHLVKRPIHRIADLVIGALLVATAAALFTRVGSSAALLTGLSGVALLGLSWRTNYAPKPVKPPLELPKIRLPKLPPKRVPTEPHISRGAKAEQVGRKAGRYAAVGVKVWKNRKP